MFAVLLYALRGRRGLGIFAAFVCLAVQCMFCLRVPCLLDLGFLFLCDSALLIFCARNGWFGLGKKLETLLTTLPLAARHRVGPCSRCKLVRASARHCA